MKIQPLFLITASIFWRAGLTLTGISVSPRNSAELGSEVRGGPEHPFHQHLQLCYVHVPVSLLYALKSVRALPETTDNTRVSSCVQTQQNAL